MCQQAKKPRLAKQTGDSQGKWPLDAGRTEQKADAHTEEAVATIEDDGRAPAGENVADSETDEVWVDQDHTQWMEARMRGLEHLVWNALHKLEQTESLLRRVAGTTSHSVEVLLDVQRFLCDSSVLPSSPPLEAGSVADTEAARGHEWTADEWREWLGP